MSNAATVRQQALARKDAGDDAGAARLFAEGLAAFPHDAAFANSAGNFHAGANRPAEALALFEAALALQPDFHEATINRGVVLTRLGRASEAVSDLRVRERVLDQTPRYWTTRAAAELAVGDLAAAAASYDAGLRREPTNLRALQGRAQVALQQGEDRAVVDHERALTACPGTPHLLVGYANALEAAGRRDEALVISQALADQLPGWVDGLELHAGLRWGRGDGMNFVDHYAASVRTAIDPAVYRSWAEMLAGVDQQDAAADVLTQARQHWPDDSDIALAEAVAAGEAGQNARASTLFDRFRRDAPAWQIAEARQLLREHDPAAAEALLGKALETAPDDIGGWGLRDLCWRLLDDPRHAWLHGAPNLIRAMPLDLDTRDLAEVRALLDRLHDRAAMPVGQSVKHGSQTRGALFQRPEPAIGAMVAAIQRALDSYRNALPPVDPTHPLLRHRDEPWRFAGSWSIRLDGAGHHASHIHPQGILSSAAYVTVPTQVSDDGGPGWLELGRPPAELGIELPALATIMPREGECALFPSTLFHGTRPITAGRRMTVAFDVGR